MHRLTELYTEVVQCVNGVDQCEAEQLSQSDNVSPCEPTNLGYLARCFLLIEFNIDDIFMST